MPKDLAERLRAYAERDGRGYPDWAVRYGPIMRGLGALSAGARIVELGANEAGFARFAATPTIAVDRDLDHLRAARQSQDCQPVCADAAALPFRSGAVDLCISVDTIEHIEPAARRAVAAEIIRVLADGGRAVVTFPSGDAAQRAERLIQQAYERYTGRRLGWFDEHAQHGLPDAEEAADAFRHAAGRDYRVQRTKNASLGMWRWMWRVLVCGWPGLGNAVFQALLRWLTPALSRMHLGTCYRAILWIEPVAGGRPERGDGRQRC
ncbi:MAG TPA: class I SAM-dependent methyltransferase [Candidatus Hydrogenedentes bacterium]|nr:class I SAM-dependent methyltransferase [Candidatus Hydrogenedentota bacterium]HPG69638.1 class I SAM-dependent methyltransferase [Candidatus Hydrogenedentota bacterium]